MSKRSPVVLAVFAASAASAYGKNAGLENVGLAKAKNQKKLNCSAAPAVIN